MKELDIKISYQCNNACIFCLNKEKKYYQEASFISLIQQIKLFALQGGEKLIVSGGEPLINKNFFDLIIFAKKSGIKIIEIQTNGRMLYYEDIVKRLKEFEPISFLTSLHFSNHKLYQQYCQSDGFNQVIYGIQNLIKYKLNFTINTVIMKPNLSHLKDIVTLVKAKSAQKIQFRFIDGKNVMSQYKKFVPRYRECAPYIKNIINENADINVAFKEIPLCVIGEKFKQNISPRHNPQRLNLGANNTLLTTNHIMSTQFIFPNCTKCIYATNYCEGVRKEYAIIYGTKEFKPIL